MRQNKRGASITVEAALVLPVFLFAVLTILYINKLTEFEEKVQWALTRVGREASLEYARSGRELVINPAYLTGKMNLYLPKDAPRVSMLRSGFDEKTDEITLIADFQEEIPFPVVGGRRFCFTEEFRTRAFTGVETRIGDGEQDGNETVYITETGRVYHKKLSCTYLTLSISQVKYEDLEYLRGEGGGKYYPCEGCCAGRSFAREEDVFICNYGNRFHSSRSCRKIKRRIQEVPVSQIGDRLPCSKCGKE